MAGPSIAFLQFWQFEPEEEPDDEEPEEDVDEPLEVERVNGGEEPRVELDRVEEEEEEEDVLAAAPGVLFCNFSSRL